MSGQPSEPTTLSFEQIFTEELEQIFNEDVFYPELTIEAICNGEELVEIPLIEKNVYSRAQRAQLVGLAFSGGGIRSATFNLGVLQGMAELGILSTFNYLSTVSGGGYIGSWLIAWIKNEGNKKNGNNNEIKKTGLDAVIEKLKPDWNTPDNKEPEEIHRLRDYSNYLTPRKGLLGADTWLLLTTYLRNSFFNLLILVLVLFAIITFINFLLISLYHPESPFHCCMNIACWVIPPIFIIICISFLSGSTERKWLPFVLIIVVLFLSYGLWKSYYIGSIDCWIWFSALFLIISFLFVLFSTTRSEIDTCKVLKKTLFFLFSGLTAGGLFFALSYGIQKRDITINDFRKDDFIDLSKVEALCITLRNDGIIDDNKIHFHAHENTIAHFNEILEITHLYDNFILKYYHKKFLYKEIDYFKEITEDYRRKSFEKYIVYQEERIRNLNWFLLDEIYPTRFPLYKIREVYKKTKEIIEVTDKLRDTKKDTLPKSHDENLISWLNRLIQHPAFYDRVCYFDFSDKVNYLAKKTSDSRNKEFSKLNKENQNNVKKLNRLLIEEMFPDDCPESRHDKPSRLIFACFGMPTVILIFLFAGALWFLLSRDTFSENERKRLGHFAVSLLGWTALITALFAVTIFGKEISGKIVDWLQYFATFAWIHVMLVMSGLLQKFIPGTEGKGAKWGFKIAIALGICIIIGGAIIISAWLPHIFNLDQTPSYKRIFCVFFISLVIAFSMAWRLNINSLSLHTLYKDRLKRAYLGALENEDGDNKQSNEDAKRVLINDFLPDNGYAGPYPIINATLNLTKGAELSWQQRKAASFVFTPLHYGYASNHRHTEERDKNVGKDAYRSWDNSKFYPEDAMAISGAAASPSMGYRSSGALAFIMTVFNVRLGQWFGNPKINNIHTGPTGQGLWYLLKELFGWSDDRGKFVYLSDGGHFENLGIYELVRRRCRYIVACDAGEDPDMEFGDLANAIEKCRTDFGIPISIDVEQMKKDKESGNSGSHYAIGTIEYTKVDSKSSSDGILVYIKASLTGDEPMDIKSYKTQHDTFPHQTTMNQMFDESQFEVYRTLGIHVIKDVFGRVSHEIRDSNNVEKFFYDLSWNYQREHRKNIK